MYRLFVFLVYLVLWLGNLLLYLVYIAGKLSDYLASKKGRD